MLLYTFLFSILLPAPVAFFSKKMNITRRYTYFIAFLMPILPLCMSSFQRQQPNEHHYCGMFSLAEMIFTIFLLLILLPISLILQSNFNEIFGVLRKENE